MNFEPLDQVGQPTPAGCLFTVKPLTVLLVALGILLVLCALAFTLPLGLVVVLILAAAFGLPSLLAALIDLPFGVRIALSAFLLAPYGVTLGMAMPLGLRRLSDLHPRGVPWASSINGITSVLASVLALAVAITAGYTVATVVAAAYYGLAAAHAIVGRWPEDHGEPDSGG